MDEAIDEKALSEQQRNIDNQSQEIPVAAAAAAAAAVSSSFFFFFAPPRKGSFTSDRPAVLKRKTPVSGRLCRVRERKRQKT
jgi:hypothetical protein